MKSNHLLRMRRSGWFDVLVFFMAIGLILGAMGLAGLFQYNSIQTSMAGATAYEVNQAQTFLSGSHRRQSSGNPSNREFCGRLDATGRTFQANRESQPRGRWWRCCWYSPAA